MRKISFFAFMVVLLLGSIVKDSISQGNNAKISGEWAITIKFVSGTGHHTAIIKRDGNNLTGIYNGEIKKGTLRGTIEGNNIDFTGFLKHEASSLQFHYTGTVQGKMMEGIVDMGEYWTGKWTAERK